jgi:hypothetical protein
MAMKLLLSLLTILLSLQLAAQNMLAGNGSVMVMYEKSELKNTNRAAYRSGMALVVLGPTKIAVGSALGALAINDLSDGDEDMNLAALIYGVMGGFHFITGVALTASGAVLLNKAKKQKQAISKVYLTIPDLMVSNEGGLGLHTSLRF